jgi:hypothetical protein
MYDWDAFLVRMRAYPTHSHQFLAPCPSERIRAVEDELGKLPAALKAMMERFNGAELFLHSFSLFRISTTPPLSPLDWSPEWCIDKFTPRWRAAGSNREHDWAIAMTNYGGLILLNGSETVMEWDTGQSIWLLRNLPVSEWIEKVIREGEQIMSET